MSEEGGSSRDDVQGGRQHCIRKVKGNTALNGHYGAYTKHIPGRTKTRDEAFMDTQCGYAHGVQVTANLIAMPGISVRRDMRAGEDAFQE